jgi:phospholipase C
MTTIQHLVLIVQENHTFDCHFGRYCTAATGSNPTCNDGPACCEAAPAKDPAGTSPTDLTDAVMSQYDPNHLSVCETSEIDNGKMDQYATSTVSNCGNAGNVAYADPAVIKPYWDLAATSALADRYFQPLIGQSASNDMYFARAGFVFADNAYEAQGAPGAACGLFSNLPQKQFTDTTIADLLLARGVTFSVYADGYASIVAALKAGACPQSAPSDCPFRLPTYPCIFDPSDIPFEYYKSTEDNPATMKDLAQFATDLAAGNLPAVSYVKAIGYKSEHPGAYDKLSVGVAWATSFIQSVESSPVASSTLVLLTYDEGGGYFDHVAPPPASSADGKPYGTRIPLLAIGPFAKKNYVSHVTMEHSSIVKFIEYNWLGGQTGQLGTRDAVVNNIGSMLDPTATGAAVPE